MKRGFYSIDIYDEKRFKILFLMGATTLCLDSFDFDGGF